jgi:hypothetical protein
MSKAHAIEQSPGLFDAAAASRGERDLIERAEVREEC